MNASSLVKSVVVAAAIAVAAPSFATTTITMTPNASGTGSSGSFGGTHSSGSFTDDFVFSVGAPYGNVGASSIEFVIDGSYLNLTTLTLNGKTVNFKTDGSTYIATATADVIKDPQTLSITGNVVGGGGSYGGQVTYTSAVPEAATWAMMLVGFGAMGGALRSNRRRAGAFA